MRSIPATDRGTTMANCFDVNLIDARTDALIGTASDCLADIDPEGDGLALTGTTFFHFKAGTLVSRGRTTVSPISPSALSPMSHITGAIPFPGTNQVLFGTGKFARQMASVRLSGAVNMSNFAARNEIEFSCIF